jgi:hypothetical protein
VRQVVWRAQPVLGVGVAKGLDQLGIDPVLVFVWQVLGDVAPLVQLMPMSGLNCSVFDLESPSSPGKFSIRTDRDSSKLCPVLVDIPDQSIASGGVLVVRRGEFGGLSLGSFYSPLSRVLEFAAGALLALATTSRSLRSNSKPSAGGELRSPAPVVLSGCPVKSL